MCYVTRSTTDLNSAEIPGAETAQKPSATGHTSAFSRTAQRLASTTDDPKRVAQSADVTEVTLGPAR